MTQSPLKEQYIFLGAPGTGKGTQALRVVKELNLNHISTGDLLRREISKGTELGSKVQSILDAGELVDDSTVLELLKANCDLQNNQYIFDGFPRNSEQASLLDEHVLRGVPAKAIYFDMDLEKLIERIVNRRVAPKSGEIYNLVSRPPKRDGICDISGEELIHRKDDNEKTVTNRMRVYQDTIGPVLDFYRERGVLHTVDASKSSEKVFEELCELIEA